MTTKAEQTQIQVDPEAAKKARAEERRARRAKMSPGQVLVDEKLARAQKIVKAAVVEMAKWTDREYSDGERRLLDDARDLLSTAFRAVTVAAEDVANLPASVGPGARAPKASKSAPLAVGDKVRVREADRKRYGDVADAGLDLSDLTVVSLHGKSVRCRTFSDESIFLQANHLERQ